MKLGFDDACTKVGAKGQFIFVQTEGSIEQQVANMQAAVAGKPDALITSLVDNNAFVGVLRDAREKGITVISSNVDATAGPELGLRGGFHRTELHPGRNDPGQASVGALPQRGIGSCPGRRERSRSELGRAACPRRHERIGSVQKGEP